MNNRRLLPKPPGAAADADASDTSAPAGKPIKASKTRDEYAQAKTIVDFIPMTILADGTLGYATPPEEGFEMVDEDETPAVTPPKRP